MNWYIFIFFIFIYIRRQICSELSYSGLVWCCTLKKKGNIMKRVIALLLIVVLISIIATYLGTIHFFVAPLEKEIIDALQGTLEDREEIIASLEEQLRFCKQ